MAVAEHIEWLEKNNLLEATKLAVAPLEKVFKECLGAKDEDVLIIGDTGLENRRIAYMLSIGYCIAANNLGLKPHLVLQEPKMRADYAEDIVIDGLRELERGSIMVIVASDRLGALREVGASYRSFAKERGHRFISASSLGVLSEAHFMNIIQAIDIDYDSIREKGKKLKETLDSGNEIHITTDKGTDLYIGINGKIAIANTGNYQEPGKGGNIPCGEVYIPPRWKHVEGKVVIDGSMAYRSGTVLIKEPITLNIQKDEVVSIEGGKEAELLKETLDWAYKTSKFPWGVKRIGELGIGINDKAQIVGVTVVDEKTKGTAHIALGSNYWFGGTIYAKTHLDQIFKNPKIRIDGKLIDI